MHGVLPYLNHPDFELISVSDEKVWDWTMFQNVSCLIFQRPFGREHAQVITAAKNANVKVILDYDDLLLDAVDMYNPTYRLYRDNQANLQTCIALGDEIWVSTPAIRDAYKHINSKITVVPNAWNNYLYPVKSKRNFNPSGKSVYYRGGGSHQADVASKSAELIKIINDNQDWMFNFCGDRFTALEMACGDNYAAIEGLTILEYFRHMITENPQVMIFPLCDTKFNRGKSNICWLESCFFGSAFYGNKSLPEFDKSCILDISTLGDTLNAPDLHQRMNETSWELIRDTLLLENVNQLRINSILKVLG